MKKFLGTFLRDESGASAAEYALIIAVVGVGIGAAALILGANVKQAVDGAAVDIYDCANDTGATASATGSTGTECGSTPAA